MSGLNLQSLTARTVLASTFSRGTYNPATFQAPEGYVKLDVKPGDQKSPHFAAAAYVNPQTGELIVAYRGSDSKSDLVTAQQAASNGKWGDQFTDAASFAKLAQGLAATAIQKFADDNDVPAVTVKPLYTGHSLGGLLAQVMSKMFGVEAQVFDAPGGARLVDTEDFARVAQQHGQPAAGHDVTGKIQNYAVTTLISGLGEQLGEKIPIPAFGQMSGIETLGAIASFLVNPLLGLTVTGGISTVEAHGSSNIEDAMYALAALQPHVANAGTLTLKGMYLGVDGKPTLENSPHAGGSNWRIQALVDPNGKVVAYFDRQSGEPFAVVAASGVRISLEHKPGQDAPDVIEKHPDGTVITVPAKALLSSFLAPTEQANPRQSGTADPGTQDDRTAIAEAAYNQLVDAFTNPDTSQVGEGVQYADAGNTTGNSAVVSDAGGGTPATPNPGTPQDLLTYLDGPGASLSAAQQYALATQLSGLGLGAIDGTALSVHSLPGGGALLANADGDIVGEVSISSRGDVRLQANTVNADGSAGTHDLHINANGASTPHAELIAAQMQAAQQAAFEQAQFNATANDAAGALSLLNTLANLQHFDQLTDLGKVQSLISLYNQFDNLGSATAQLSGGTGGNLPGDLSQWGAGLSLITALQGNDPIAQASAAGAFYNTFASSANTIPLPYLQTLNLIGAIESGNTVSMVASAVAFIPGWGTAASIAISIIAPLFADKPPPPEGATHFEWDASGNIQIKLDFNQSRGGEMAQSTAQSVQSLLNSIVQSINDRTPDTSDNVAINPYLLPRVGYSQSGGAWIEMTTPDGGSYREVIQGNNLAQRLFDILLDNGGIAPVWQVQTQLGHMQQLLDQGTGQGEIAAQLGAGAGGHAYHGNQAYALQGNATESADFKTQSFGALVVHLRAGVVASDAVQANTQALQALQDQQAEVAVQTSELYRDTEGDGYFEKTEWVSATDAQGNLQGLLVLDYNGNGQIETRDILNLGGNAKPKRYVIDSCLRKFHECQWQFLFISANTSRWRDAA